MNVFILATCRKPELLPYTLLVFNSLRTGFPTAKVHVDLNPMGDHEKEEVLKACRNIGAETDDIDTIHHKWIEFLVENEQEPFYLLDTDVILYGNMEQYEWSAPLAGWRIPEWRDDFSSAITRARLHTSLLYVNPKLVLERLTKFISTLPEGPFTPFANPYYPLCLPFKQSMFFYDTCALLYHAVGGQAFSEQQLDLFLHLNFGTIPDLVLPRLPPKEAEDIQRGREMILKNPVSGHGAWRSQLEYYASKPV